MRLFRDKHFERLGLSVDLLGPVVNMEDVGYSNKTQSIDVISGVYVHVQHSQCLDLTRPNACLHRYGVMRWLELLYLMTFVFLAGGWPLRILGLVVRRTSWRKVFMKLQRTGGL